MLFNCYAVLKLSTYVKRLEAYFILYKGKHKGSEKILNYLGREPKLTESDCTTCLISLRGGNTNLAGGERIGSSN